MVKNLLANSEGTGSISRSRRSPGEGDGNPLQYACLGNSMDRRTWGAAVYGMAKEIQFSNETTTNHPFQFAWDFSALMVPILGKPSVLSKLR